MPAAGSNKENNVDCGGGEQPCIAWLTRTAHLLRMVHKLGQCLNDGVQIRGQLQEVLAGVKLTPFRHGLCVSQHAQHMSATVCNDVPFGVLTCTYIRAASGCLAGFCL